MINQTGGTAAKKREKGRIVLRPFDYDGVKLLPGRFRQQMDNACKVYGALANDDILKGFREAAGLPAPGRGMSGWCSKTSGGIFGQLISGLARLGRATGDAKLIDKAQQLFSGWLPTLAANGDARMRPYAWDKLVCGLVDLHRYGGDDAALTVLERTTQHAAQTFDRTRQMANRDDFWGGGPGDTPEWYTLPENLYRAYLAGAGQQVKEFADLWLYEEYWRQFENTASPSTIVPVHAYSHVNSLSSAAMAYAVSGDKRYLRVCENSYDFLQHTQCYATGGYGPDERFMPADGSLGRSLELYAGHAEIPCGSWAAVKLSRYLMSFSGQARYGDWIETLLYNGIGAALPTEPGGRTYYYGDYRISGGIKQHYWHDWPCCSGTYLQTVADYPNLIYLRDAGGISVNLYLPSEVSWQHLGEPVTLRQETDYPQKETSTLTLKLARPTAMSLRFRVPGWSAGMHLAVNDQAFPASAGPGDWMTVEREWSPDDRITVTIPMNLRMTAVDKQHPSRVAIMYGPVVLAQDEACCRRPFALHQPGELFERLVRESDELRFRITDTGYERHTRYLQPFYTVPGFWPYWVYFDLDAAPLY